MISANQIPEHELLQATALNGSFSKTMPGLQVAWDSTSMGTLKECPRKYYYTLIQGFRTRKQSMHLTFGLHLHSSLEKYDHLRAQGVDHEEAIYLTMRYLLELTGQYMQGWVCEGCGKQIAAEDQPEHCACGANFILEEGVQHWVNWNSGDANKNRENLIRSVQWYLDVYKDDAAKTVILRNGKPAVELSFRMELPLVNPEGKPYIGSGHMDRVVEFAGANYVLDRKTTKSTISSTFFEGFSPDNQMSLYNVAAQVVLEIPTRGVIIDACQIAVNFTRFQRGFTMRTPDQMREFLSDFLFYIKQAEQFAEARYWPMNDKSCGNYGGCPFRGICSKSESVRNSFLETNFKRQIWDPLVVRGE